MAGGNFMHRVFSYVVNELIVNSLANSPSFQRFAVRTSKRLEDVSSLGMSPPLHFVPCRLGLLFFRIWSYIVDVYISAGKTKQELAERMRNVTDNFKN
ncbi:unnamed protein product [Linum tenue]|uniref:Uncharacterized protein n=1 Tax=Linum tenue TaxID=586396 RepID=A0AAV0Q5F1_9ROSI|nr:unnamed protein product [Linum tenue]